MTVEQASCYCGNITADVTLTKALSDYTPRACDCDFCIKNGSAYISDPEGELSIKISNPDEATNYRQGDNLVDLLICRQCGVMVAVTFFHKNVRIGGINANTLNNRNNLAAAQPASPKLLSASEKVQRWSEIWFPKVTLLFD